MRSGPDVFADALVPSGRTRPRNALVPGTLLLPECPLSPERSDSRRLRRPALKSPPIHIDRSQASAVSLPPVAAGASSLANLGSCAVIFPNGSQKPHDARSSAGTRHCAACCAGPMTNDDDTDAAAMVIVLRNRRVNRTSRLVTSPCAAGISAISRSAARCARLHPVHREP